MKLSDCTGEFTRFAALTIAQRRFTSDMPNLIRTASESGNMTAFSKE